MLRKRRIHNVLQTCPQSSIPNTKFNLSIKHVANENWFPNPRPPASRPSTPDPHHGNGVQLALGTNDLVERTLKREAPAPIPDAPRKIVAHSQIYPGGRAVSDDSHQTIREHRGVISSGILGKTPVGGGTAGVGVAQLPIRSEILTPGERRVQDRILTLDRILTIVRILTRVLVLVRILTGTPMPPRILTRITLVRTLTRILILTRILTGILMLTRIPIRTLTPSRIITGIPILARTLIRILMLDGNLEPEEILILGSTPVPDEIETSAKIHTF